MSPRHELAERLAIIIRDTQMTRPFGGDVTKGDKYYGVLFAKPRILDGLVRVYSPRFILIECQGPLMHGDHQEVYESEQAAAEFLRAVGHAEIDKAMAVPTRRQGRMI